MKENLHRSGGPSRKKRVQALNLQILEKNPEGIQRLNEWLE